MGDSRDFPFGESDFGIVGEFLDGGDASYVSDNNDNMESAKNSLDGGSVTIEPILNKKSQSRDIQVVKIEDDRNACTVACEQSRCHNGIDFTADITFDQLKDEEIMEHLTDIENISLDAESLGIESEKIDADGSRSSERSDEQSNKSLGETHDVILVEQLGSGNNESLQSSEDQWYNELINTKVKTVVERFSKLARVLKFSYPCYKNCLDRIEAEIGMPVCKLDPPQRCPLNRTNINRWKFICTANPIMESEDSMTESVNNVKKLWQLEPCDGSNTITNNSVQTIPTFVIRAVKMFENFINSLDQIIHSNVHVKDEIKDDDVIVLESDEKLSVSTKTTEDECKFDLPPQWLWLLVRCNSKGELMMFATGKYITRSVMDSLKELFESGLGKNCKVKSLYCKAMTSKNNVQMSNTTFLVGTEALDETVGELKIQLAPKTNFWLSTAGAEELAKKVEAFLDPPDLGTVIDIGCGLGLMGLSIARKCYQVIGIDSPSEVEEAEMTCELNKIKNAYFLMGEPAEMMTTIQKSVEWRRAFAIINANTNIGRTIEVMIGLRKIKNLRRIVMVTTLTKQSVRSILELTRPADDILGDPFVATRAAVVDTLPTGPQFEVVILMERRPLPQMLNAVLSQVSSDLVIQNRNKVAKNSLKKNNSQQKTPSKKPNFVKNTVALANRRGGASNQKLPPCISKSRMASNKIKPNEKPWVIVPKKFVKNPFYEQPFKANNVKRISNQKEMPSATKPQSDSHQHESPSVSRPQGNSSLHISSIASRPQGGSNQPKSPAVTRLHANSKSHRKNTANLPFYMRNKMNNVSFASQHDLQKRKQDWNLGSGSGHDISIPEKRSRQNDDLMRPRMTIRVESNLLQKVQEQQRLLEVAKQKLTGGSSQVVDDSTAKEVQNMLNLAIERTNQIQSQIPRSVWDRIAPPGHASPDIIIQDEIMFKGRHVQEINQEDIVITTSNKGFRQTFDASWAYNRCSDVPPLEPNLVMPRDTYTNVKFDVKNHKPQHLNDATKQNEARWVPPLCSRRPSTPPSHSVSLSPKKLLSPPNGNFQRQTPIYLQDIARPSRQFAPSQRCLSPQRQEILTPQQDLMDRCIPSRRPVPPVDFGDEWDIPSRGASEQQTNWQRTIDDRQSNNSNNRWTIDAQQDKPRQGNNPHPIWDGIKCGDDNRVINSGSGGGGGDVWNRMQMLANQPGRSRLQQHQHQIPTDNRFIRSSGSDWNVQGKEVVNMNNTRNEVWEDATKRRWSEPQPIKNDWNQSNNKEEWNDLPEDARDPWGNDSGTSGPPQGNWSWNLAPHERSIAIDNRCNPRPLMMKKPQLQTNVNSSNSNVNNARWGGRGIGIDNTKKPQHNANWQQGNNNSNNGNNSNNIGWRQQNSYGGLQQQRPYN